MSGARPLPGQRGVTLVETMVYVAISAIVLIVLSMTLRNMSKGFVQGAKTVRMQQGAREAINIMNREIRNTGLKHAFYQVAGVFKDTVVTAVAQGVPSDSSSFMVTERGRYDQISFRQARLDANGAPLGIDTVTYQVDSVRQMLRRRVNTGAFEDFCPNIDALQFQYGIYAQRTLTINQRPPLAASWTRTGGAALAFTPTRMVLSLAASGQGDARSVTTFAVNAARSYYLEISVRGDADFFDNGGVLEALVINSGGSVVATEAFLPGRSMANRSLMLTPPTDGSSRLGIRIKATGRASVRIGSIRFGQADLGAYTWRDAPTVAEKKTVRAVKIMLMAKAEGAGAAKPASTYLIGNHTVSVTDTRMRRYYEEEVPVSNNGIF